MKRKVKSFLIEKGLLDSPKVFHDLKRIGEMPEHEIELACRAACAATYLGKRVVLCRVLTKFIVYADADDIGITPHFCLEGFWEMRITKIFAQTIQKGFYCADIGANHGYFSLLMADIAGADGRLLAVEPNPKLFQLLSQNVEVNGFLKKSEVHQKALTDTNGEKLTLMIPDGRDLNATVVSGGEVSAADRAFEVETATLDELTKDWKRVDFVKIDAEGAEEKIWRGMRATVEKNPQIIVVMEFKRDCSENPKAFLESIIAAGFRLRHIDSDGEIKDLTIERALTERAGEDWMLFLQRD